MQLGGPNLGALILVFHDVLKQENESMNDKEESRLADNFKKSLDTQWSSITDHERQAVFDLAVDLEEELQKEEGKEFSREEMSTKVANYMDEVSYMRPHSAKSTVRTSSEDAADVLVQSKIEVDMPAQLQVDFPVLVAASSSLSEPSQILFEEDSCAAGKNIQDAGDDSHPMPAPQLPLSSPVVSSAPPPVSSPIPIAVQQEESLVSVQEDTFSMKNESGVEACQPVPPPSSPQIVLPLAPASKSRETKSRTTPSPLPATTPTATPQATIVTSLHKEMDEAEQIVQPRVTVPPLIPAIPEDHAWDEKACISESEHHEFQTKFIPTVSPNGSYQLQIVRDGNFWRFESPFAVDKSDAFVWEHFPPSLWSLRTANFPSETMENQTSTLPWGRGHFHFYPLTLTEREMFT